jgi:Domain of unknown function (DUF4440)
MRHTTDPRLDAYIVVGDMAFTSGYERTHASIDGEPRRYVLRATQVYRREDGNWKVAPPTRRHGFVLGVSHQRAIPRAGIARLRSPRESREVDLAGVLASGRPRHRPLPIA